MAAASTEKMLTWKHLRAELGEFMVLLPLWQAA